MMNDADKFDPMNVKRNRFAKEFFYSLAGIFLFYIILDLFTEDVVIVSYKILLLAFCTTLYTGFIISKTKYDFLTIFKIIFVALSIFVIYLCLLLSSISGTVFILFVPLVLMIQFLFSFRASVVSAIFFLVLCFFLPDLSKMAGLALSKDFYADNPLVLRFQEYLISCIATYFSFLILYHLNHSTRAEVKFNSDDMEAEADEKDDFYVDLLSTNDEKYELIYERIIRCFEVEKPFDDPEFNIRKLAILIDSNSTYVSRALNMIGNRKFNQLVNEYRINQVKEELKNDMHHKFTIEHIYKNAGFSQQSTFNRIFKEYTGTTPSEYIEILDKTQ